MVRAVSTTPASRLPDRAAVPGGLSRIGLSPQGKTKNGHAMRTETQNLVDEIKQAISLLRRHL